MDGQPLQAQCELGQEQLMRMEYLAAGRTLAAAERVAWARRDFDALARLYMPLQEARRQRRQRCGEGIARLDLLAQGPADQIVGRDIVENYPNGQLLVAGWGSIEPARQVRQLQAERDLYVETFLAAVYPVDGGNAVAIVATEDSPLPPADPMPREELRRRLPPHSLVLSPDELPRGSARGNAQTWAIVMALWERLHAPFLADADAQSDPLRKIAGYRQTIEVDYACELAHQHLSDVARQLCKSTAARPII
jgi:hypothetical protein